MAWPLAAVTIGNNYSMDDEQPVLRTQMEQGPQRKTLLAAQYSTFVTVEALLSGANLNTFRSFYAGEAAFGAGWFDMDIITTQGLATHRVRIEDSSAILISNDLHMLQMLIETEEHIA